MVVTAVLIILFAIFVGVAAVYADDLAKREAMLRARAEAQELVNWAQYDVPTYMRRR